MKIAIVGGGISGLATAFYIKQQKPDVKITLFEKEEKLGGKMATKELNGFLFEEGSNGFLSNKPDTLELVKEIGCDALLMKSSDEARKRFIYKDSLHKFPETLSDFLKSKLLSPLGKLRVAAEIVIPRKKDDSDETLQDFGYRRIGKEMSDTFLDAMVAGVFASSPDKISVKSAFPAVVNLEQKYGSLFRGMFAKKRKDAGPGGILMSFKGGVSSFIEQLANSLEIEIFTGIKVKSIEKSGLNYLLQIGEEMAEFDQVVLSTPSYNSANLLKNIDSELSLMLKDIEYSPISVVGLGYNEMKHNLRGFGLLTTALAKKEVLGVLWDSSIFNGRAPNGKKSLRVMIGGQRNPKLALVSETELVDIALRGISETMNVQDKPEVTYVKRWVKGIPNYRLGHQERMDKLFERLEQHKGLYLSSNAYFGVGLNDCVANSKKIAKQILERL